MSEKACYICGRVGVRGFRWFPEKKMELPKQWGGGEMMVGGWHECLNKHACRSRIAKQQRRYESFEGEYL